MFQWPALSLVHPWLTTLLLSWKNSLLLFYWVCGFWKFSRQIWLIFMVHKRFQLLGCKVSNAQKSWQQILSPGPKSFTGRSGFQHFMRLRNQLVIAAENLSREENLSSVLIQTMSQDMEEQLKQAHKVVDVVDRPYKSIVWLCCGTMWTNRRVHMLKSDYLQGRRRTRSFNKLSMCITNMKNLSIYLM